MEEIDKIGSEFMIFCFHSTVHTEKKRKYMEWHEKLFGWLWKLIYNKVT